MFNYAYTFNQNIQDWETSRVTNMKLMFASTNAFNQDISKWEVSEVTTMASMFSIAKAFNQPLSNWQTSKVTDMSSMFYSAAVFNQDLSVWDVSKVTTMASMFKLASTFDSDLSTWDVRSVTLMNNMFESAVVFNSDISKWVTHNAVNMVSNLYLSFSLCHKCVFYVGIIIVHCGVLLLYTIIHKKHKHKTNCFLCWNFFFFLKMSFFQLGGVSEFDVLEGISLQLGPVQMASTQSHHNEWHVLQRR